MQAVTCLDRNYSPFLNECSWQLAMQWSLVVAASDERIHPGMFSKKHVRTKGKGQGSVWVLSWSRKACTILAVWEPAPSHSSSHHRPGTITHLCSMRFPPSSIRWDFLWWTCEAAAAAAQNIGQPHGGTDEKNRSYTIFVYTETSGLQM